MLPTRQNLWGNFIKNFNNHREIEAVLYKLENRICRKIQDMHASFGIKERMKHRGCS